MRITQSATDTEIMTELGKRLKRCRIDSGLSQTELSERTGISVKTIANMEEGMQSNSLTLIRVLRALKLLDNLEVLAPCQDNRPIDYYRYNQKAPERVSRNRHVKEERTWKWGDEK
jgi:transcriptional regulator with XRE-family HTH domain